jgi:hypothetical protein
MAGWNALDWLTAIVTIAVIMSVVVVSARGR